MSDEYKQEGDEAPKSDRMEKTDNLPCGLNDTLRERSKCESHEKAEKQTEKDRNNKGGGNNDVKAFTKLFFRSGPVQHINGIRG